MNRSTRIALAISGVIVVAGLVFLGVLYAINIMVRQTAEDAVAPIHNANSSLQTQVAELLHPTPTILPNPVTIIHEVRSLARLETIQYTVEKVITAEQGQGALDFLFGDKLLFVGHGTIIAGVDLSRLEPDDIWIENEVLYFRMPQAEIFVIDIDNEKSYVYDRETGLLTKGDVNLEKAARIAAEQEISKTAIEDGIISQAQANAESYMSRLLRNLGYPEVIIVDPIPLPTDQPEKP